MLALSDVHTYYGESHVLQGITLSVSPGEVVTILGRNGMGKTTLMRSIIGFTPPRRGRVRFKGDDITRWPPYRMVERGMALVPQGRRVFASLTVRENLEVAPRAARALDAPARPRAVPPPRRPGPEPREQALRRRAADARHRTRADDRPRSPPDGRADRGARAPAGARGGSRDRRAQARGALHPARRAESAAGALRGRRGPHPEPGSDRALVTPGRVDGERRGQVPLSRRRVTKVS